MSNYTFPGGQNTFVPTLMENLIIEFSRNPAKFPIVKYINFRKVDKQRGYYVNMRNDNQGRYIQSSDAIWSDGNDAPGLTYGNDQFEYPIFNCTRYGYVKRLGYLGVEQASWDILDQASRLLAQDAMTFRSRRVHTTLTTSGNWGANYATATTLGGGSWASASSTNPYIRKTINAASIAINKGTYGAVDQKDLYLVMNPNLASEVALSGEFLDFIKQQPGSLALWESQTQFRLWGLPEFLMGVNIVVDDTVINGNEPGTTPSFTYSFPDNYALIVTKQQAIAPSAGGSFSTFELFGYSDMETFVYNDVRNRRYELQVSENVDDTSNALVATQSGYLIAANS